MDVTLAHRVVRRFQASLLEDDGTGDDLDNTPEERLEAIRLRARLMLRRLTDPRFETEEMLAAFAWIAAVA